MVFIAVVIEFVEISWPMNAFSRPDAERNRVVCRTYRLDGRQSDEYKVPLHVFSFVSHICASKTSHMCDKSFNSAKETKNYIDP